MGTEEAKSEECRCPVRPYGAYVASGSTWERARLEEWQRQHGHHAYAKARDTLADALIDAENSVRRGEQRKAGEAVLDMVHDVYGLLRRGTKTVTPEEKIAQLEQEATAAQIGAHACEEECCLPK